MRKAGELGLLGVSVPEAYGGLGMGFVTTMLVCDYISGATGSVATAFGAHTGIGTMPITLYGTEEQKKKYLPDIISGKKIGTLAVTEYESGSDDNEMKTTAFFKGSAWVVSGMKPYVTNAPAADYFLVAAASESESEYSGGITIFIVARGTSGCIDGEPVETMGLRGSSAGEIILNKCSLRNNAVIGSPGEGVEILAYIKNFSALCTATCSLGIAAAAMDSSNTYSKERKSSGRYLNRYQEIAFKLADMMIETDISRLLLYKAAWELDNGSDDAASAVSCAKIFATEAASRITGWGVQIFGGKGYLKGTDVERFYRDAKFGEIAGGTSELQRIAIAGEILDRYCN